MYINWSKTSKGKGMQKLSEHHLCSKPTWNWDWTSVAAERLEWAVDQHSQLMEPDHYRQMQLHQHLAPQQQQGLDTWTVSAAAAMAPLPQLLAERKTSAVHSHHMTHLVLNMHTHTYPFNSPFPGLPRWAGTRKVKPIWTLLKQETVSGTCTEL